MAKKLEKKVENVKEVWIEVNDSTKVRINVNEFQGVHRVDIRKHITTTKYTGFTKEGINVVTEKAEELYKALGSIINTIKAEELYNPQDEEVAE